MNAKVAIIMGSSTDLEVMQLAEQVLDDFGVESKIQVVSAHRTPEQMQDFALKAEKSGFQIIIAGAGGAAHLPGMVASLTSLPVIGVPVNINSLNGIDALLSIAQMPKGVPVATMAVDNAYNAGLLAVRILALSDPDLKKKLNDFKQKQVKKVESMNKQVEKK